MIALLMLDRINRYTLIMFEPICTITPETAAESAQTAGKQASNLLPFRRGGGRSAPHATGLGLHFGMDNGINGMHSTAKAV